MTSRTSGVRATIVGALGALALLAPAAGAAAPPPGEGEVARTGDVVLDPAARGNVTYGGTANVASYQQDGVLTYKGWQYAAWYRGDKTAAVARRKLPHGAWESTELDFDLFSDDSHNTIAMTITPSDGRLHVAFPTHANAIRYTRSVPGIADDPAAHDWSSTLFERTGTALPGAPAAPRSYTYPQFELVKGRMLLTYRDGITNNGKQVLLRYDDNAAGTWSYLGRFTDSRGVYRSAYGVSTSRYSYLHGFNANPVTGDLEISWTWREQNLAWCANSAVGNHDLGYARSPDGGTTWLNNAGVRLGRTGSATIPDAVPVPDPELISIEDDHVVVPQRIDRALINQETQAFDAAGRLHVVTSSIPEEEAGRIGGCPRDFYLHRALHARPTHHWRDADGTWRSVTLPFGSGSSGRTKLAFDAQDDAYIVLPDARIASATAGSGWTDWRIVFDDPAVEAVSELILDRHRLRHDGVLTVAYQEPGATPNAPGAFRIADFELATPQADQPRSTTPAASPRPYGGSAGS